MAFKYKTKAFTFKKNDVNDSDRNFSVFTEDFGRLDIYAKAIRKTISKLRSGIDVFFVSDIEFIQGKRRKTLTDAIAIEKYGLVVENLEKFEIANKIGRVLDDFINGEEKDEKIFYLLEHVFSELNSSGLKTEKLETVYYYFLWNVLSIFGYRPEVEKCNVCHEKLNPYVIYFSDKSGGVMCQKCLSHDTPAEKINSDIVKILRLIFKKDRQTLLKLKVEMTSQKLFQKISDNYYSYILSSHSCQNVSKIGG